MQPVNAVELRNVTKTFGSVVANNNVSLDIRKGEILSCWEKTAAERPPS